MLMLRKEVVISFIDHNSIIWKTAVHLPEWPVDRSFMGSRSPRRHLGSGSGSGDHSADVQSQTSRDGKEEPVSRQTCSASASHVDTTLKRFS